MEEKNSQWGVREFWIMSHVFPAIALIVTAINLLGDTPAVILFERFGWMCLFNYGMFAASYFGCKWGQAHDKRKLEAMIHGN